MREVHQRLKKKNSPIEYQELLRATKFREGKFLSFVREYINVKGTMQWLPSKSIQVTLSWSLGQMKRVVISWVTVQEKQGSTISKP